MDSRVNKEALDRLRTSVTGTKFVRRFKRTPIDLTTSFEEVKKVKSKSSLKTIPMGKIEKSPTLLHKYYQENVVNLLNQMDIDPMALIRRGGKWYIDNKMVRLCNQYNFGFINKRNEMVFNEDFMLFVELEML